MHLSPEMWRMLPAFWVIGLLGIGYGAPLWLRRVRPNPFYGLELREEGDRDDIWYPVNALLGRDLVLVGVRILVMASVLATFGWRHPRHYVIVAGCVVVAEAMVMTARWQRIGRELRKQMDAPASVERETSPRER